MAGTDYLKTFAIDAILDKIENEGQYLAVGTGTTPPIPSDTSLENEVLRKARQEYTRNDATGTIILSMWIASTEANGNDLSEVGVFDSSTGGKMLARETFPSLAKTQDLEVWIDIEFEVEVQLI